MVDYSGQGIEWSQAAVNCTIGLHVTKPKLGFRPLMKALTLSSSAIGLPERELQAA